MASYLQTRSKSKGKGLSETVTKTVVIFSFTKISQEGHSALFLRSTGGRGQECFVILYSDYIVKQKCAVSQRLFHKGLEGDYGNTVV